MIIIKFNDGHWNFMMIMRTVSRIIIFKGTRDSLNDGHENLMIKLKACREPSTDDALERRLETC